MEFLRNNRGINDGKDIPQEYLENLYNEIKNRQIQMDIDINAGSPMLMDFADSTMWNKILHKGSADQAPAAFTSTLTARRQSLPLSSASRTHTGSQRLEGDAALGSAVVQEGGDGFHSLPPSSPSLLQRHDSAVGPVCAAARVSYERDLFLAMSRPVLETLVVLYDSATDDQLVSRIIQGLWDFIAICDEFGLHQMLSR